MRKDEFQVSTNLGDDETFRVAINDLKAIVDREFDRKNEVDENVYGQKVVLTYEATLNEKAAQDTGRLDLKMMCVWNFQTIRIRMAREVPDIHRGIRLSVLHTN